MANKLPEDTIYLKVNGKYKRIGRLYDREHMPYGTYFVTNSKHGNRSMHWLGAAPNPDFIQLETAVEESRDNLKEAFKDIVQEFVNDPYMFKSDYYSVDKIIQAIRKTFLDKKKKMLDIIGQ